MKRARFPVSENIKENIFFYEIGQTGSLPTTKIQMQIYFMLRILLRSISLRQTDNLYSTLQYTLMSRYKAQ